MTRRTTIAATISMTVGVVTLGLGTGSALGASTSGATWKMDELSGTTMLDSSGNGNTGRTSDVAMTASGYTFNGSSSKVVVPSSASLNPGASDFSYSVRLQTSRVPPSGTDYDLIRKGVSSTSGGEYKLEVVSSNGLGKAFCLLKDTSGVSATALHQGC